MTKLKMIEGNFLSKELKELKSQIMNDLIDAMFSRLTNNIDSLKIDEQAFTDIFMSCIIMFTRDMICHAAQNANLPHCKSKVIEGILSTIEREVEKKINKEKMN